MSGEFESILHVISRHARERSAQNAIIFLARGETETERVCYGALESMIESHAGGFAQAGLSGKTAVIAMPPGAAFSAIFLGALRARTIAVPVSLPDSAKNKARLEAILRDARPAAVVTAEEHVPRVAAVAGDTRVLTPDELRGPALPLPAIAASAPAFVQYTSGSTEAPKGIAITHGNLMANQRMIQAAFGTEATTVGVSWLPHFHDMGLIGTILQPLFVGCTAVLMPPKAFIQKPIRWLRAIEAYRSDIAGGPCFGFELCTRTISEEAARSLDLSSWKVAFCGAEPIRPAVLDAFAARFAPARFSARSLLPCYGLAEATLIVSSVRRGKGLSRRTMRTGSIEREHVSCGAPAEGGAIVLRGEDGTKGEICVGGAHLAPGYWDAARHAIVPFAGLFTEGGTTYLPTGDIGVLSEGELYVVDRLRDFLILYGAKIHAADVETTALDASADIRAACAFATDDGLRERLVVLCEADRRTLAARDTAAWADELARSIAEAHGIVPAVRFAAYGTLPRTSSGKIQRARCRTNFLSGGMDLHKVETNAASPPSHAE